MDDDKWIDVEIDQKFGGVLTHILEEITKLHSRLDKHDAKIDDIYMTVTQILAEVRKQRKYKLMAE